MQIKIKDKNQLIDATIEVVDGVLVVSPKEEKYEPKDGDIVTYMNGDKATIYVFAGGRKYNTSFYVAYSGLYNVVYKESNKCLDMNRNDIRPATEEEKKLLFDKIEAEGYEWNPNEKKLVKKMWKPKRGEICFHPFCDGTIFNPFKTDWVEETFYFGLFDKGWVFPTKEECQSFCDKLNQAINQIKP